MNTSTALEQITRVGVYGLTIVNRKILVVTEQQGVFKGQFNFPGGGIEFGESVEEALCREYREEVAMQFGSFQLLTNLTAVSTVRESPHKPYTFYQIGMIYRVDHLELIEGDPPGELPSAWVEIDSLTAENSCPLLWKCIYTHR